MSKYVARREKDMVFNRELARRGIVTQQLLLTLVDKMPISEDALQRICKYIAQDFSGVKST
jgi:hypothetical protein